MGLSLAQFAGKPAYRVRTLEGVGAVAIEALERAPSLAAGRQSKDQKGPTMGACRSLRLSHRKIVHMPLTFVCSVSGSKNQIRPLRKSN
jgi:hypothetical protein